MSSEYQQVVEDIVRATTRFLKDRLGHGPEGHRAYFIDDMIVIRFMGTMTSVEYKLAETSDGGRRSVKDTSGRLVRELRPALAELITKSTGATLISVHSDLSTKTGERIVILVLDRKVRHVSGGPANAI